ncbi:MAG: hypothetical protein ABR502_04315 [Chitinophagaceae bacterium]
MKVREFGRFSESDREKVLSERGVLIGTREKKIFDIQLYQVDAFYVELFHHRHFNVPVKMKAFSSTDQLTPYFGKMDINNLVGNTQMPRHN